MAVVQLTDGRWICYYRVKGEDGKARLKKEYFGRGPVAETQARKRNDELGLMPRRPAKPDTGPLFSELAKAYALNKDFNENSLNLLLIRLEANILPIFGNKPAVRISDQDMTRYVKKRRQSVKLSTITRELTDIKAILNWSASTTPPLIPFNPVRDFKKPSVDHAVNLPPTEKETEKILSHSSPHLVRAIMLSYYLGLRPGAVELLSLTWDRVSWDTMTILIKSAHKGGPGWRQVPIHKNLAPLLRGWALEDENKGPIIHYRGKAIKSIKTAWRKALERAKIKRRLRPYDLRHHFVTRALEGGADMKALSEIVGSRPETLMKHYQHVSGELHRKTVATIPPIRLKIQKKVNKRNK